MKDRVLSSLVKRLQAVCVFAADIVPTKEIPYASIGWRSGRGVEPDKTGPMFSYERVLAAAALYRENRLIVLVPSGGYSNLKPGEDNPSISAVVAFELTQLGVPRAAIIEEPTAFDCGEQVVRCAEIMRWKRWEADRVAILAPCWNFARISALIALMPDAKPFALGTTPFISMERALAAEDAGWNARFAEWYAMPEVREVFAKDALGTGQLWAGHQPLYPKPYRGFNDPLALPA